jgi:hypothetical protein
MKERRIEKECETKYNRTVITFNQEIGTTSLDISVYDKTQGDEYMCQYIDLYSPEIELLKEMIEEIYKEGEE